MPLTTEQDNSIIEQILKLAEFYAVNHGFETVKHIGVYVNGISVLDFKLLSETPEQVTVTEHLSV